jgi:signal transduction histidine kinase
MAESPSLLDALPDTVLRLDRSGTLRESHVPPGNPLGIRSVPDAGIRQLGLPANVVSSLLEAIAVVLRADTPQRFEAIVASESDSQHLEVRVVKTSDDQVVAILRDITASQQAASRSLQAERLAAIGQMVAGLAHESRNAFQRSQAYLEVLAMEVEDRPDALELVERIQQTQDHLHYLYEEVRSYAAPINLDLHTVDLRALWRTTWTHLEAERAGKDVVLRETCSTAAATCRADPNALEQVFRNVLQNAIDACEDPAWIEIRCQAAWVDGSEGVEIRVADNGPGLEPSARGMVFEPFFTTKTKGTGLGMAIARRLVDAHRGRIEIGASAAGGTEVVIALPSGHPRANAPSP